MKRLVALICSILMVLTLFLGCSKDEEVVRLPVFVISDPIWLEYYIGDIDTLHPDDIFLIQKGDLTELLSLEEQMDPNDSRPRLVSPLVSALIQSAWRDDVSQRFYYFLQEYEEPSIMSEYAIPIVIERSQGTFQAGVALATEAAKRKEPSERGIPIFYHAAGDGYLEAALQAGIQSVDPNRVGIGVLLDKQDRTDEELEEILAEYTGDEYTSCAGFFLGVDTVPAMYLWRSMHPEHTYLSTFTGDIQDERSLGVIDLPWTWLMEELARRIEAEDWSSFSISSYLRQ